MTFSYRILPPGLHVTADAAVEWFIEKWGLKRTRIEVEASFDPEISFRPTFFTKTDDGYLLCIEVSESIYNNTLDSVVLDCRDKGLPVKLVVAVPRDVQDAQYSTKLKKAKRAGVGVFEVDSATGTIVQRPLSLSLTGVRPVESRDFPRGYRQALVGAHQTFCDGEPSKACSVVYDELEDACRRFAATCYAKKLWPNKSGLNISSAPWANLMSDLDKSLVRSDPVAKRVTPGLIARIVGVTGHRNQSGHRPRNLKELVNRDRALRTRFESAVDLLKEFVDAVRGFRI